MKNVLETKIKDIAIVVGKERNQVAEFLKEYSFEAKLIEQKEQLGTGHAISLVREFVDGENFVCMYGDGLYSGEDIAGIASGDGICVGCAKHNDPSRFGVLIVSGGELLKIVEKPKKNIGNLINVGLYRFTSEIFKYLDKVQKSKRGEYEVTDAISIACKNETVSVLEIKEWIDVTYPWHMLDANRFLLDRINGSVKGEISEKATLNGKVIIEENAKVLPGAVITGPVYIGKDCIIGPNCSILGHTAIMDSAKVGFATGVKNSIIMKEARLPHHNYVGDSVIGEGCNLGAGTKIANLRFDDKPVKVIVKEKLINSGKRKLGCFMGDNVKTGVNVSIMPGIMIWPNTRLEPGSVIYRNIEDKP